MVDVEKVFVVTKDHNDYSQEIVGVYSSEKDAKDYTETHNTDRKSEYDPTYSYESWGLIRNVL